MDKEKIVELHEAGLSQRRIAAKLGVSKTSVHRAIDEHRAQQAPEPGAVDASPAAGGHAEAGQGNDDIPATVTKGPESHLGAPPVVFTDVEARFLAIMESWQVPNARTVIQYLAALPAGIFEDMTRLRKALLDSAISPTRVSQVVNHWAALNGLPAPAPMMIPGGQGEHRFSIIRGQVILDGEGELTLSEALKIAALQQPVDNGHDNQPSPELQVLRDELKAAREQIDKLRDSRIVNLEQQILKMQEHPPGTKS